jgi:hypothetical protein
MMNSSTYVLIGLLQNGLFLAAVAWIGLLLATLLVVQAKGYSMFWTFVSYVGCAPAALFFALAMPPRK